MARSYKRDSSGRFSSTGGSGKGRAKAGASVAARKQQLVKNVSSAALKGQKVSAASRSYVRAQQQAKQTSGGKGNKAARKAATVQAKAAQAARSKAFSSKAGPNKAKAAYKAATSKAREAKMLAGGRTSTRGLKGSSAGVQRTRASVKAAQSAAARVRSMEKNRGRKRSRK